MSTASYTYLVAVLAGFLLWLVLFFINIKLRKALIYAGLFLAVYGLVFEYFFWTRDWWHPITITGTRIGIEDFIAGFSGSLVLAVYPMIFKKTSLTKVHLNVMAISGIMALQIVLMFLLIRVVGWLSTYATFVTYLITAGVIFYKRRDLISNACVTGAAALIISIPLYFIAFSLTPDYVARVWVLSNLSGIQLWGIPVEDLIFNFLLGFFIAPFAEFALGGKMAINRSDAKE